MNNRQKVNKFTDSLYELLSVQNLNLDKALEILSEDSVRFLSRAAREILSDIRRGNLFSNTLVKNRFIRFDYTYIAFICYAEKTGNILQSIQFLKERCERKEENLHKVISASLYPLFVILLAIVVCVSLCIHGNDWFGSFLFDSTLVKNSLIKAVSGLLLFCFAACFLIQKNLGENKLYEAFLAVNFLVSSGIDVSTAVGYGILVTGPGTRYGKLFQKAKDKLEFGMNLRDAFTEKEGKKELFSKWQKELDEALFFAQKGGEKNNVFEKVCKWMEKENQKRRLICLSVLEPLFIAVTGFFLLILMGNLMIPLMNYPELLL